MLNQAIDKIKTEKAQNAGDPYVQVIGDLLLRQLEVNPGAAAQIMVEGKTIAKSIDEMANVAKKKAKGNRAMLTDREGFEVVLKYFEIKGDPVMPAAPVPAETVLVPEKKSAMFDVRLEDLL